MKGLMKRSAGALLVLAGLGLSANAFAVDIKITGTVKAASCTVDVGSNGNIEVKLGDNIQATDLTAGNGSNFVPFSINLKDCPPSTTGYVASFSGTMAAAPDDVTKFTNSGTATGVQIDVVNADNSAQVVNGYSVNGAISGSTGAINLKARAYSTQGNAMPGSIDGLIQVTFTYS